MSKRLIIILALVLMLGITAAYAEVQNVKVSGDLTVRGINRSSVTLKDNETRAGFGENINAIISQVRLRVDADLTDNVSTTVRLLNERVWGAESTTATSGATSEDNAKNTKVDLDLAYVTLKEFLYSPLTLTIGRQELAYGNKLIIGDVDTNVISAGHATTPVGLPRSLDDLSLRKSFDAIKATLNYDPLLVDLIYSRIETFDVAQHGDVDLYGAYATYVVNKDIDADLYLFQRSRKSGFLGGASTISTWPKRENLRTLGAKAAYRGIKNTMVSLEGAYQFGSHMASNNQYPSDGATLNNSSLRRVNAWALQAIGHHMLPVAKKYSPTVGGSYTYFSGNKYNSQSSSKYKGWDPMYEDTLGGTLINKLIYNNFQIFSVNASAKPTDDLKATIDVYYARLNNPYPQGSTAVVLNGVYADPTYSMKAGKKYFGTEVDLGLTYDYTEDVQFNLNGGAFLPGSAFDSANHKTASQVIGSMKVTF